MFTGLRQSEALGLRWADVDFDAGLIHVRGQLSHGREFVETGETAASRREVVLMPSLAKLMREHKAASRFSQEHDFVFAAATGRPPSHRNTSRRGFEVARDGAGLDGLDGRPRFRWHDMRHCFASILIGQGRDARYVAAQLGHAKASITLDTYAHLFDRQRHADETRAALEAGYGSTLEALAQSEAVQPVPSATAKVLRLRGIGTQGPDGNGLRGTSKLRVTGSSPVPALHESPAQSGVFRSGGSSVLVPRGQILAKPEVCSAVHAFKRSRRKSSEPATRCE